MLYPTVPVSSIQPVLLAGICRYYREATTVSLLLGGVAMDEMTPGVYRFKRLWFSLCVHVAVAVLFALFLVPVPLPILVYSDTTVGNVAVRVSLCSLRFPFPR